MKTNSFEAEKSKQIIFDEKSQLEMMSEKKRDQEHSIYTFIECKHIYTHKQCDEHVPNVISILSFFNCTAPLSAGL